MHSPINLPEYQDIAKISFITFAEETGLNQPIKSLFFKFYVNVILCNFSHIH